MIVTPNLSVHVYQDEHAWLLSNLILKSPVTNLNLATYVLTGNRLQHVDIMWNLNRPLNWSL